MHVDFSRSPNSLSGNRSDVQEVVAGGSTRAGVGDLLPCMTFSTGAVHLTDGELNSVNSEVFEVLLNLLFFII